MGKIANIWQIRSAERARILLICPHCGQEASEFADSLRGKALYDCRGDGCDYRFDLMGGARDDYFKGFAEACRRFYATLVRRADGSGDDGFGKIN